MHTSDLLVGKVPNVDRIHQQQHLHTPADNDSAANSSKNYLLASSIQHLPYASGVHGQPQKQATLPNLIEDGQQATGKPQQGRVNGRVCSRVQCPECGVAGGQESV